jgi:putative polyhydroxyalkanoate system protein
MTRPLSISIPHELGAAEARRRIETGFDRLERQISGGLATVEKRWEGDRMHFVARGLGQTVSGRLTVLERSIDMEVELPAFLAAIADKIRGRLQKEGQLLLEKK